MDVLKTLKQELLKQKEMIEKREGVVIVNNLNPSPAEITAGINSIPVIDLSEATATENDVKQGKTFYSGDLILKTGSAIIEENIIKDLFMYTPNVVSNEDILYYTLPEGMTSLKPYCFSENANNVYITFNDELELIDKYAFYKCSNFSFNNFNQLTNINEIGDYAFQFSLGKGIDFSALPNSITNIGVYCFVDCIQENEDLRMPSSLMNCGSYAFQTSVRTQVGNLDMSNYPADSINVGVFSNLAFNCDFVPPANLKILGSYLNYGGCFTNVILPETIKTVNTYCFGAKATDPVSNFYLRSVIFASETPPTIGQNTFANQNLQNSFKIYVPDTAVEAYKAVKNLTKYADYIFPISQAE